MRLQKHLSLGIAILCVRTAFAVDPVPAEIADPLPASQAAPAKARATDADSLIAPPEAPPRPTPQPSVLPDEIPVGTKRPAKPTPPVSGRPGPAMKPQATAEELDLRVRYRKARIVAEANETVRIAWAGSRGTKSDHAKRQALRYYYDVLFAQMLKVDRGIAPLVEKQRAAALAALSQTHIAPTVPIE